MMRHLIIVLMLVSGPDSAPIQAGVTAKAREDRDKDSRFGVMKRPDKHING